MSDEQTLRDLILNFLALNPEPADAQMHALAEAIGADKESVESLVYKMLSQAEGLLEEGSIVEADSQDVLDDIGIDPEEIPLQDVANNDGLPSDEDIGFQEETFSDGAGPTDVGVGLEGGGQDLLTDDGFIDLNV